MLIKKYIAKSMREALLQIKEELGEDAIILKSSKLQKKIFGPDEIEVTAAVDEDASAQKEKAPAFAPLHLSGGARPEAGLYGRPRSSLAGGTETVKPELPEPALPSNVRPYFPPRQPLHSKADAGDWDSGRDINRGREETERYRRPGASTPPAPAKREPDEIAEIKAGIQEMKDLVKSILSNAADKGDGAGAAAGGIIGDDSGWDAFVKRLTASEVKPNIAKRLVNLIRCGSASSADGAPAAKDDAELEAKIIDALSEQFPTSGPLKLRKGSPLKVAFVGPTGSGKTTTLAKLAAHCCFNKSKKISIITADTYRIAAIEQIRTFADIVSVGLQVIFSPEEIPAALAACEGSDVVFVDTAGRSQRNKEHMEELRLLMDVLRPDETHLVLSATTKDSDLIDMVHNYRNVRVNRLLFTKLDETAKLGNIFNVVSELGIPVSYFTVGQSVPDDIELAQAGKFVKKLMEGRAL